MLLIGVNRSPYTRRVAITLQVYGIPYEQRDLSGFANWAEVKVSNPLGRIPALVLDDGEALVDSAAFIAERLARVGLGMDTAAEMPRLHALGQRLLEEPAFAKTEPS